MAYKFTQPCSIQKRKDLFALLRKLESLGYKKGPCPLLGMGERDEYARPIYLDEDKYMFRDYPLVTTTNNIDCGDNEEMFFALAALRDDTNEHQWFIATDTLWDENYDGEITTYFEEGQWFKYDEWSYIEDLPSYFRKATVEEIIEHFKK